MHDKQAACLNLWVMLLQRIPTSSCTKLRVMCRNWEPFMVVARKAYEDTEANLLTEPDVEAFSTAVARLEPFAVRVLVLGLLQLLVQIEDTCEDASQLLLLTAQACALSLCHAVAYEAG